jgi:hypothetical protein
LYESHTILDRETVLRYVFSGGVKRRALPLELLVLPVFCSSLLGAYRDAAKLRGEEA